MNKKLIVLFGILAIVVVAMLFTFVIYRIKEVLKSPEPINKPITEINGTKYITQENVKRRNYRIINIDGCEYIEMNTYGHIIVTHKGNCTNCIHRLNNKER